MPDLVGSTVEVPVLETARLRLRGHRLHDFPDCKAMWTDPVVFRHIGGKPFSPEEVWTRLLRYVGHWAWLGFGYWAVEEKASGRFIGELGFGNFQRDIEPSLSDVPELGWALVSQAHGKGYATEGVGAAIAWGDQHFGQARTACLIHPDNAASIRVAEKCGYRQLRRTPYKDHDVLWFER